MGKKEIQRTHDTEFCSVRDRQSLNSSDLHRLINITSRVARWLSGQNVCLVNTRIAFQISRTYVKFVSVLLHL